MGNNAEIAGQAGAIDVVVEAFRRHINDADICLYGFGALRNLTTYSCKIKYPQTAQGYEQGFYSLC